MSICYSPFELVSSIRGHRNPYDAKAVSDVFECDFLNVDVAGKCKVFNESPKYNIAKLPELFSDVIVFSLLLECWPTSDRRICC